MKHHARACAQLMWYDPSRGCLWQETFPNQSLKKRRQTFTIGVLMHAWLPWLNLTNCCLNSLHSLFCFVKDKAKCPGVSCFLLLHHLCVLSEWGGRKVLKLPLCPCNVPRQDCVYLRRVLRITFPFSGGTTIWIYNFGDLPMVVYFVRLLHMYSWPAFS